MLSYVPFFFYPLPSVHQPLIGSKTFSTTCDGVTIAVIGPLEGTISCRKISRCKWLVTDPPQCQANLRDHFPDPLHFTSERCDARASHRERSAPRDGSEDHTRYASHRDETRGAYAFPLRARNFGLGPSIDPFASEIARYATLISTQ